MSPLRSTSAKQVTHKCQYPETEAKLAHAKHILRTLPFRNVTPSTLGLVLHRIFVSRHMGGGLFEAHGGGPKVSNSIILKIIGPVNHNDERKRTETSGVLNEMK